MWKHGRCLIMLIIFIFCLDMNKALDVNEPFDAKINLEPLKSMEVSYGRIAAIGKENTLIGFDLGYVSKQNSTSPKINLSIPTNGANHAKSAITSDYVFYSFNKESGLEVRIYNRDWNLYFTREFQDCSLINLAAGSFYIGEDSFSAFVIAYQNQTNKKLEIYEEDCDGTFSLKQSIIDDTIKAGSICLNENLLVVTCVGENDLTQAKFMWRDSNPSAEYVEISNHPFHQQVIKGLKVKNERVMIQIDSYTNLYVYNRFFGSITEMSQVNRQVQDIAFYQVYNKGYLMYLDEQKVPSICTYDEEFQNCVQIVTLYPSTHDPETIVNFDRESGYLIASSGGSFYYSRACSPNNFRKISEDGSYICRECRPGTTNMGYSTICSECSELQPQWSIYGPNPGCNWQCFLGGDANSCTSPFQSILFWSVLITCGTILIALFFVPVVIYFGGSFKVLAYTIAILSFGLFISLPNFGWRLFSLLLFKDYVLSIYSAPILRLLFLGIPIFVCSLLLFSYLLFAHKARKSSNPNFFRHRKYPPTRLAMIISMAVVFSTLPGFVIYLLEYLQFGVNFFSLGLIQLGIFWYTVPLSLGVLTFFVCVCLSCRKQNIEQQIKYEKLSVNINDNLPPLLKSKEKRNGLLEDDLYN